MKRTTNARALVMVASMIGSACEVEESVPSPTETPLGGPDCDDAPLVDWHTFGNGFVVTHCQGCHASTATDRRDAPVDIVFDTAEDVARFRSAILDAAGSDVPRMPPNGGTTEDDRARLRTWLTCFAD